MKCRHSGQISMKLESPRKNFVKFSKINFAVICPVEAEVFDVGGGTDNRHDEDGSRFSKFSAGT